MSQGIYVNTNISSISARKNLGIANHHLERSFERLSSGYKINRASDDAAGISVSENMRKQIRGMDQGLRNAKDALSMAGILDNGVGTLSELAQRMRELAIQANNGSYSDTERTYMNNEFVQLREQGQQIANTNEFNSVMLMDGSGGTLSMQIGFSTAQNISTTIFNSDYTGFANGLSVDSTANATAAIAGLDTVMDTLVGHRAQIGAFMNRMESVLQTNSNASENFSSSERQIRDTDFAQSTAQLSRYQIIQQVGTTVLSQANATTSAVTQLIQ